MIKKHVFVGTLIITDGHPSYPKAIHDSFRMHEIVNHRLGLKNKNGGSTKNIENVWSLMRYKETKEKELKSLPCLHFWKNLSFVTII